MTDAVNVKVIRKFLASFIATTPERKCAHQVLKKALVSYEKYTQDDNEPDALAELKRSIPRAFKRLQLAALCE